MAPSLFCPEPTQLKTGPLAHVWLAADRDRRLSRSQVLQSDILKSIGVIVEQGPAPAALRLSSQLLLGVAHIYGKKANYLRDDCQEALLKIQTAINGRASVGPPRNATENGNLRPLELLTIDDLFPAMDFTYRQVLQPIISPHMNNYDPDWTLALGLPEPTHSKPSRDEDVIVIDEDLWLDFGDGDDFGINDPDINSQLGTTTLAEEGVSKAMLYPEKRPGWGMQVSDSDIDSFGDDAVDGSFGTPCLDADHDPTLVSHGELFGGDEGHRSQGAESMPPECGSLRRESDTEGVNEQDGAVAQMLAAQPGDNARRSQRGKKQKFVVPDANTVLSTRQLQQYSADRSSILKEPVTLLNNRRLVELIDIEGHGGFVTNTMNDGVSKNWAPELEGLLSLEAVDRTCQKRKRYSVSSVISDGEYSEQLAESADGCSVDGVSSIGNQRDQSVCDASLDAAGPSLASNGPDLEDCYCGPTDQDILRDRYDFEETTMSLSDDEMDDGLGSLDTNQMMTRLREKLDGLFTERRRSQQIMHSILLQDVIPERYTSKQSATMTFFEILVLATKDLIELDQGQDEFALPLRIRGRPGLRIAPE